MRSILQQHGDQNIRCLYIGDGFNDYCASLHLRPSDIVLARKGHTLEKHIRASPAAVRFYLKKELSLKTHRSPSNFQVQAQWRVWNDYATLRQWLEELTSHAPECS